ncbi:cytochrome-c peroxidase [Geobacter sp.]|uniref:cytochrome-c peroxidase n=1 Tax=Geobacter sp. TaxID=46610 RepID=UPI001AC31C33|nr:cytochrome c peroxidase [Geobacter sp.]CAG0990139.1 Methylamine utilization protein MauG [Anaerolineales bacterium]
MKMTKTSTLAGAFLLAATMAAPAAALSPLETLGKKLFFDTALSANGTQSCAACHAPEVGFTGPDAAANTGGAVYEGALPRHFGNRKPPTSAYAGDSPVLHYDEAEAGWFGGMFWDGRATGAVLGDPLAEQAQGPYLNPLEQAIPNAQVLCTKVRKSDYAGLFEEVWGAGSLDCAKDVNGVYENIGRSVAAYERSAEVNPFTSKFDKFWDTAEAAGKDVTKIKCGTGGMGGGGGGGMGAMGCPGGGMDPNRWTTFRNLGLSDAELQGLAVFNDPNRANCSSCHTLQPGKDGYPLFTDFSYDNIGTPKNPANPFYSMPPNWNPDGANWVDYGLGGYLKSAGHAPEVYEPEMGKQKVPTLRNVDLRPSPDFVKAYGHNGFFKSLDDIVFFYHWRAMMDGGCMGGGMGGGGMGGGCDGMATMFPPPEVDQNRATLGMFPRPQVDNIVLFLKTLSDGYFQR